MRYIFTNPLEVEIRPGVQVTCTEAIMEGWRYFKAQNPPTVPFSRRTQLRFDHVQIQYSLGFRNSGGKFVQAKEYNPTISDDPTTRPANIRLSDLQSLAVTDGRTWEEENVICLFNLLVAEGHLPDGEINYQS